MCEASAWSSPGGPKIWRAGPREIACQRSECTGIFRAQLFPKVVRPGEQQGWQQYHSNHGAVYNHMNISVHAASCMVLEGWGSAGDPRGIRWGSSGDPHRFRGIRPVVVSVWPTFWGEPSEGTAVFYNIKKGHAAWAMKTVWARDAWR